MVYKVGGPSAQVASAAVNPNSDKYIGVRIKQSGFGAVIKKNHSEINLGIYDTAEEAARAYDMAALVCQGDRAKVNDDAPPPKPQSTSSNCGATHAALLVVMLRRNFQP